jgi:hypothetical protein
MSARRNIQGLLEADGSVVVTARTERQPGATCWSFTTGECSRRPVKEP